MRVVTTGRLAWTSDGHLQTYFSYDDLGGSSIVRWDSVEDRRFVETHELRDKGRARIALRVLSLGNLDAGVRPYRVRVTLPAKDAVGLKVGEAIALNATLQPPPEPIEPGATMHPIAPESDRNQEPRTRGASRALPGTPPHGTGA